MRTRLEVVVAPAKGAVDGLRVRDGRAGRLGLGLAVAQPLRAGLVDPLLGEAVLPAVQHHGRGEAGEALELHGGVVLEDGRPVRRAGGGEGRAHQHGVEALLALGYSRAG